MSLTSLSPDPRDVNTQFHLAIITIVSCGAHIFVSENKPYFFKLLAQVFYPRNKKTTNKPWLLFSFHISSYPQLALVGPWGTIPTAPSQGAVPDSHFTPCVGAQRGLLPV